MTELSVEMVQLVTLHTIFARRFQEFGQVKIIELPMSRQTLDDTKMTAAKLNGWHAHTASVDWKACPGQRVELIGDGVVQGLL
jgi:hypothetical protein